MGRPAKLLAGVLVLLALLGGACWLLLAPPEEEPSAPTDAPILLSNRTPGDVTAIQVENTHGGYTFTRTSGGYALHDLPPDRVNGEYVDMLLDEASLVSCTQEVTDDLSRLADFGLDRPEADVRVDYSDGTSLRLLVGAQEPISGGRYCMAEGDGRVLLMKENRTIRFTMAVERYLDYIIIPPEETQAVLSTLQDMSFSGTSLPDPIVLRAVLPDRPDTQREALAFGSVTHLVEGPVLREVNPTALTQIAEDLLGLISEGIVAYNCDEAALAAYGFHQPWLQIDFDYKNGADAPVVPYTLKVVPWEDGYIATVNDQGIVYRILDLSFLHVSYEDMVLRWFYSPFLTDVAALELESPAGSWRFELSGAHARDLSVQYQGAEMDSEAFRSFYNLVVSAASDAPVTAGAGPEGEPLLTLRYLYRDAEKEPDELALYPAPQRRLYVATNGLCQFTIRESYLSTVTAALEALLTGESFSTVW